jgi:hypothetical protein
MKHIVYGIAASWAAVMVISFVLLETTEPTGEGLARGLNRLSTFLALQGAALLIATGGALAARSAQRRGAVDIGRVGYAPLAVSLFLLVALIAIIAYRVLVPTLGT